MGTISVAATTDSQWLFPLCSCTTHGALTFDEPLAVGIIAVAVIAICDDPPGCGKDLAVAVARV